MAVDRWWWTAAHDIFSLTVEPSTTIDRPPGPLSKRLEPAMGREKTRSMESLAGSCHRLGEFYYLSPRTTPSSGIHDRPCHFLLPHHPQAMSSNERGARPPGRGPHAPHVRAHAVDGGGGGHNFTLFIVFSFPSKRWACRPLSQRLKERRRHNMKREVMSAVTTAGADNKRKKSKKPKIRPQP